MQELYSKWLSLLDEHEKNLKRLEKDLTKERKALLANQVDMLKESYLSKDKSVQSVEHTQATLDALREATVKSFGVSPQTPLKVLFELFSEEENKELQKRRLKLSRISKTVKRLNTFNNNCLETYLDYVNEMQSILTICSGGQKTYSPQGKVTDNKSSGKLISRSL